MTTNRCNLKCSHCYQDAGNAKEAELSTEEGKKLIDEIVRAGSAYYHDGDILQEDSYCAYGQKFLK